MNSPIRLKDPNAPLRNYTFSFSFGGLATLLTAFTLALSLFFVLGVLVGRGHRPEAVLPPVARIMPTESVATRPEAEVLKPEELGYGEQLGKKADGPTPSRPIDKVERKAPEKKDEKKADKPVDKKAADKKSGDKPGDKKDEKKADPDTQRYDYAYQAASFPDLDQAKAFLKRVKGLGLKADIESGATGGKGWHRVVVFFQGTPTDTRGLKEKLGSVGAQKLLMRSKTPI